MTQAMHPLSISTIQALLPFCHSKDKFNCSYIRESGNRMFFDVTPLLRHKILRRLVLKLLTQLDKLAPEAIKQLIKRPEFKKSPKFHPPISSIGKLIGIFRKVWKTIWKSDLTGFVNQTNTLIDSYVDGVESRLEAQSNGKERLNIALNIINEAFSYTFNWLPETAAGIIATKMLARKAKRWLSPEEIDTLTLGIPGNVVNEIENTEPFIKAWNEFISQFGMRGPSEIDLYMPRWYEDPLPVLQIIKGLLQREKGFHRKHQQSTINNREVVMKKLIRLAGEGFLGHSRVRKIERLYYTMIEVGGMREHHKFFIIRILAIVKETLNKVAKLLVEEKKISQSDDLWFLTWEELFSIWEDESNGDGDAREKDWPSIIESRRNKMEQFTKITPPLIITSDGEIPVVQYNIKDAPEGALLGNPVSSGVYEGIAHIIHDIQHESLSPGEVLVAKFTDPGWTPLFINAGALILETGGTLTHGSVVAREYGIPAVVGVRDATTKIFNGQRVRVDGNRGIVEIIHPSID